MDSVIAWLANYLLWVMLLGVAAVWIFSERTPGRIALAAAGLLGLLFMFGLIVAAAHLHTDPRPFVVNPSLHPLISHNADNGFPSDHSAAAALLATLVALRHRWAGTGLVAAALVIGAARMAAHVHHLQDVAAGLAIGLAAALLATAVVTLLARHLPRRNS